MEEGANLTEVLDSRIKRIRIKDIYFDLKMFVIFIYYPSSRRFFSYAQVLRKVRKHIRKYNFILIITLLIG